MRVQKQSKQNAKLFLKLITHSLFSRCNLHLGENQKLIRDYTLPVEVF